MSKLNKFIKDDYQKKYNVSFTSDEAKKRLNIDGNYKEERNFNFMKKGWKIFTGVAVLVVLVAVIVTVAVVGGNGKATTYASQEITIDHNPSISLTTDDKGVVASVHGNNDEGKMIVSGEVLVGLDAEEAMKKILAVEVECGYFVKGEDSDVNGLQITVNVSSDIDPEKVANEISSHVQKELDKLGVKVSEELKVVADKAHEELVNKACELDPTLDKAEVEKLSDDKILALISAYYLETAELPSEEIEQLYKYFKEYQFDIASSEAAKTINGGVAELNNLVLEGYEAMQKGVEKAYKALEAAYLEAFVAEDSLYQEALAKLVEAKNKVLALRAEIAEMEDGAEKSLKLAALSTQQGIIEAAEGSMKLAQETFEAALKGLRSGIDTAFAALDKYMMDTEEVKNILDTKADEISAKANEYKDKAFEKFEAEYADQITASVKAMQARKAALIEQMKQYAK